MPYNPDRQPKRHVQNGRLPRTQWDSLDRPKNVDDPFDHHQRYEDSIGRKHRRSDDARHSRSSTDMRHSNGTGGRSSKRRSGRRKSEDMSSWTDVDSINGSIRGSRDGTYSKKQRSISSDPDAATLPRRTIRGVPPPNARQVKRSKKRRRKEASRRWLICLAMGAVFSVFSLGCMAAAFATGYWTITDVDRVAIQRLAESKAKLLIPLRQENIYRSNHRGLFETCYDDADDDISILPVCVGETGYEIQRNVLTVTWGPDYELYIHIMRVTFIGFILAMVFQLLSLLGSIISCMRESKKVIVATATVSFFALLFICGAMGAFHAVDHYERTKLVQGQRFPANWAEDHPELAANHTQRFGYSYFIGWVAAAFGLLSLILYIITYVALAKYKVLRRKKKPIKDPPYANASTNMSSQKSEADTYYTTSSQASRNIAYDMAEFNIPPPDELDCVDEDMFSESTKL